MNLQKILDLKFENTEDEEEIMMNNTSNLFKCIKVLMYGMGVVDKKAVFLQEEYERKLNKQMEDFATKYTSELKDIQDKMM